MLVYLLLLSVQVPANIACLIIAAYSVASGGCAGIPADRPPSTGPRWPCPASSVSSDSFAPAQGRISTLALKE